MDVDLYVEGEWREVAITTLSIQEGINGKCSLRCDVQTAANTVPELDDEVEVTLGGSTVLFAGLISEVDEKWLDPTGARVTTIVAEDFSALAERRLVKASTTGGVSGRDAIDFLVTNYLGAYGVTRDPAMPAGATLGALTYDYAPVSDVLNDIVRLAAPDGWLWRIDENRVLRAWAPGLSTYPCPWSLTTPAQMTGDPSIIPSRERYANRVILAYNDGTSTPAEAVANDLSEQSARGIFDAVLKVAGPIDGTLAAALADSYLRRMVLRPRTFKFPTITPGAHAGQVLTVNLPDDALVGDFLITDVQVSDLDGVDLTYQITAVEGGIAPSSWKETYRTWAGNGASSGLAAVGTIIITVPTPAPSVTHMGGSMSAAVVPGNGAWTPAVGAPPYVAPQDRGVVFRADLRARSAGVTVTARLRDLTAGSTAATTSTVTGVTPTLVSAAGAVIAGHRYEFQLSADADNEGVYGVATLESA